MVASDGGKSYTKNKVTNKQAWINREQGQYVTCGWAPVKEGEVAKEMEKVLQSSRLAVLATESEVYQGFARRV